LLLQICFAPFAVSGTYLAFGQITRCWLTGRMRNALLCQLLFEVAHVSMANNVPTGIFAIFANWLLTWRSFVLLFQCFRYLMVAN